MDEVDAWMAAVYLRDARARDMATGLVPISEWLAIASGYPEFDRDELVGVMKTVDEDLQRLQKEREAENGDN